MVGVAKCSVVLVVLCCVAFRYVVPRCVVMWRDACVGILCGALRRAGEPMASSFLCVEERDCIDSGFE